MPEKKFSVFISHASSDQDWAKAFAESLRQHGQQVWLDREALSAGDSIQHQIETGLRESNIIVLLWNPNSLYRSNLFFEIGAAMGLANRLSLCFQRTWTCRLSRRRFALAMTSFNPHRSGWPATAP